MRAVLRSLLLSTCLALQSCQLLIDTPEPMWARSFSLRWPVSAAFSDDGKVLWTVEWWDGSMTLTRSNLESSPIASETIGQLTIPDENNRDRTQSLMMGYPDDDSITLAVRPGTDELWIYFYDHLIRFPSGSLNGTIIRDAFVEPSAGRDGRGGIAFIDTNTLAYANGQLVARFTVLGDHLSMPTVLTRDVSASRRSVAAVDGQVWVTNDEQATVYYPDGRSTVTTDRARFGSPMAASAGGVVHRSAAGYCVTPVHPDGGAQLLAPTEPPPEGYDTRCPHIDLPYTIGAANVATLALSRDGQSLAIVDTYGRVVVATAARPADASDDLSGTWCNVSTGTRFNLEGTTITGHNNGSMDGYFEKVSVQGFGPLRTIVFDGPSEFVKASITTTHFDHYFKRSGDTLVVLGPVTAEQRASHIAGEYLQRTGVYLSDTSYYCGY